MQQLIKASIEVSIRAKQQLLLPTNLNFIEEVARLVALCFERGNKVLIAGNGGSLCDAAHFAEELTGFFRSKRKALPALVLSEPGHLTCVGNDAGFEHVFARGIEAYGKPGDLFFGLTTSGVSPNLICAFERAIEMGLGTVAFLGRDGGKLKGVADHELIITDCTTSDRIQEAHMTALHILIECVEQHLFGDRKERLLQEILAAVKE